MTLLVEGEATPAQIAAKIDEPINNVNYHIKVLVDLGCAELVGVRPAGGGRVAEHVYRATRRPLVDDEAWSELDQAERLQFHASVMRLISEDIEDAMATGTFYDAVDSHVSRMPMSLDEDGWEEVVALLTGTLDELLAIQARVEGRTDKSDRPHHTKVNIIHFRSPPPKSA
jgi:predicted ArsR family transcriptional regulator